jgi:hypothetical protein
LVVGLWAKLARFHLKEFSQDGQPTAFWNVRTANPAADGLLREAGLPGHFLLRQFAILHDRFKATAEIGVSI